MPGTQDCKNLVITPHDMDLLEKLLLLSLIYSLKQPFLISSLRELRCTENDLTILSVLSRMAVVGTILDAKEIS